MVINVLTHEANHALYAGNHVLGNAESDALMLIHHGILFIFCSKKYFS
jgi:hypothetical protein